MDRAATSHIFSRRVSARLLVGAAAGSLAIFALRDLLAVDPRVLDAEGLLQWFTQPRGLWLPLVLLGAAWLAWRRAARASRLPRSHPPVASLGFAAAAIGAALWAQLTGVEDLWVFATLFAGAAWAARRGLRGVRVQAVPLLFLLFAVAPPPRLVSEAYWWIQSGSARAATALVRATGRPVLGEGIALTTPTEVFGIIESCTALGILVVLSAGAVLLRERIVASGPRSWLLVASAPLIALLLNLARITSIVLYPSLNRLHHLGQWAILLLLGTLLLFAVARALSPRGGVGRPSPRSSPGGTAIGAPPAAGALVLAAILAAVSLLPTPPARTDPLLPPVRSIPMERGEWTAVRRPIDSLFLGYVMFREVVARRYEREGEGTVDLFVGEASPRSEWSSPFSPKTILPGMGWVPAKAPAPNAEVELPLAPTQTAWVARDAQRWWVVQWRFGDPGLVRESLQQLVGLDAQPFSARRPRRVIRLSTPLGDAGPEGVTRAQAALAAFARDFADVLFPEAVPASDDES